MHKKIQFIIQNAQPGTITYSGTSFTIAWERNAYIYAYDAYELTFLETGKKLMNSCIPVQAFKNYIHKAVMMSDETFFGTGRIFDAELTEQDIKSFMKAYKTLVEEIILERSKFYGIE